MYLLINTYSIYYTTDNFLQTDVAYLAFQNAFNYVSELNGKMGKSKGTGNIKTKSAKF